MWVERYKPKSLGEFVDQREALRTFLDWIREWRPGQPALLFYGPAGTGKSCLLEAYAFQEGLDFIEMNASDLRSAKRIRRVLGQAMSQRSLSKRGKILVLDEVDGLAGVEDRGGVGEILRIVRESRFPVVLIANDPWRERLRGLRACCKLVEFKKIHTFDIQRRLEFICAQEGIRCDKKILRVLAKMARGDLRAAINNLEVVGRGRRSIGLSDLEALGYREELVSIFDALRTIFKTRSSLVSRISVGLVDKDLDEIFWWIEENVPREYERPEEIAQAFDALSRADLFRQRVRLRQNWRLRKYMIDLMTGGVSLAKKGVYSKFVKYAYPSKLIVLGRSKLERRVERERLLQLSRLLHCSTKKIRSEFLPFLGFLRDFVHEG